MQRNVFDFLGQRIELWTHPEPDHLAMVIRTSKTWYETDVLMKCRELYLPGTAVIDVGANIGNHTVFFAAILGATVHAFEPFQPNYDLLQLNLAANGLEQRVTPYCCAVGEHDGQGTAHVVQPNNLGGVRIGLGEGDVVVRSLDSLAIPGPVGLLKVDVEGGEVPVLRGARLLIRTWLPDILIEAGQAQEFHAAARVLLDYGYVPKGRYAWTPTYLFSAADQTSRLRAILGHSATDSG
jgi:FkbM family methyltransferase